MLVIRSLNSFEKVDSNVSTEITANLMNLSVVRGDVPEVINKRLICQNGS